LQARIQRDETRNPSSCLSTLTDDATIDACAPKSVAAGTNLRHRAAELP
jgi:hypothetical protein